MGGFQCRDNTFEFGKFVGSLYRFVVVDCQYVGTALGGKVSVYRTNARIIQSGGNGVWLLYLSVLVLDDVCLLYTSDAADE